MRRNGMQSPRILCGTRNARSARLLLRFPDGSAERMTRQKEKSRGKEEDGEPR